MNWAISRAFLYNAIMISPYDYVNESMYNTFGDNLWVNKLMGCIAASIVGTFTVLPLDNMKTRI